MFRKLEPARKGWIMVYQFEQPENPIARIMLEAWIQAFWMRINEQDH